MKPWPKETLDLKTSVWHLRRIASFGFQAVKTPDHPDPCGRQGISTWETGGFRVFLPCRQSPLHTPSGKEVPP